METSKEIANLLDRPLWQMSGREFVTLAQFAFERGPSSPVGNTLCTGVRALAEYLGCCEATIYVYKREGILDDAIVSRIGKRIVFDGEIARKLATAHQEKQFHIRQNNG